MVDVLLGLQWGDEGKGKIVDVLANQYDMVARFQGGPNAGHTLVIGGKKMVLHTIPSGVFHDRPINLIGNGVVINPVTLKAEIENLESVGIQIKKQLYISKKASLILPTHKILDAASEAQKGSSKIGSTLRGIGPTYMDKTGRNGIRVGDILSADFKSTYSKLKEKHLHLLKIYDFAFELEAEEKTWFEAIDFMKSLQIVNSEYFVNDYIQNGKKILAEGAQGCMLDIDFGTYPYVTSSNTVTASACNGLGISPSKIKEVIGISKAYCTRVGSGPFTTELEDEMGEKLRKNGNEFGATTGRPRRCGWIDLPALKYTSMLTGLTKLIITKIDVLNDFDTIKMCTRYLHNGIETTELPYDIVNDKIYPIYDDFKGWNTSLENASDFQMLPNAAKEYLNYIETYLGVPISLISNAPDREKMIIKDVSLLV
ncbi:MAG: adenylosuccinate synthase [Bacteroidota bacterium]